MLNQSEFAAQSATVTSTLSAAATWDCRNAEVIAIQITNTGAAALTGCTLKAGVTGSSSRTTIQSSGFTTSGAFTYKASGDPTTLAAGSSVILWVDVSDLATLELDLVSSSGAQVSISSAAFAGDVK